MNTLHASDFSSGLAVSLKEVDAIIVDFIEAAKIPIASYGRWPGTHLMTCGDAQLHVDRPGFSNPCRCQLCKTLGGINLTVDIEDSMMMMMTKRGEIREGVEVENVAEESDCLKYGPTDPDYMYTVSGCR